MTRAQHKALGRQERADRDLRRREWHANLGPLRTPQLAELHEDLWDIIDSNLQDGDKAKGAVAVDAFPGLGKTTSVLAFAREFHRREIAEQGEFTAQGDERVPVCRVGLTGNTGMKDLNRAMLEFFGHPGRNRGTTAQLGQRALDCVLSCEVRLLVLDDLHFLKWRRTNGIEVSNHLKWIANEFPVTLLMVGVGLADKGLFSEGGTKGGAVMAQTGRRTTRGSACGPSRSIPRRTARSGGRCCWHSNSASSWPTSTRACSPTTCPTTSSPGVPDTSAP
ncbi:AAA family ATPase [Streptomyces acidicola]|uniref:AAA family ATPase n=1 Tax=Streptomyces acidicola TaxID=2596892 RepID=UPI0034322991